MLSLCCHCSVSPLLKRYRYSIATPLLILCKNYVLIVTTDIFLSLFCHYCKSYNSHESITNAPTSVSAITFIFCHYVVAISSLLMMVNQPILSVAKCLPLNCQILVVIIKFFIRNNNMSEMQLELNVKAVNYK